MGLSKVRKIKLEAKKQAAEALKRKLKYDELERETTAHSMWREKLDKTWRDTLLKMNEPAFRQQIEVMWHTVDRTYDKKDGLRDHIMYLRDIANNQYARTIAHFAEVTGNIINTFLQDLENMVKLNEMKTADILKQNKTEVAFLLEYKRRSETHLQLQLYTSHQAADTIAWNAKGENMVRKHEDASKYLEIFEALKYILDGKYVAVWEEYKNTIKNYIHSTAQNQKQLKIIRKKEQLMTSIIAAQAKKLISSELLIRHLRAELLSYELGEKQAGFRDRRRRHRVAYSRLKNCMNQGMNIDVKQINRLVAASGEAIAYISAAQKKCEKILRIANLCRKYETQREKIIPFGIDIPHEPIKINGRSNSDDPLLTDELSSTCGLTKLWQRISKAELSKRALVREKIRLELENADLELQVNKTDEISLPEIKKCPCTQLKTPKASFQPHAVDGSLELRKFIRY